MKSPLLLGNDVTAMDEYALGVVGNHEVIAINQVCGSPGEASRAG